MHKFFRADLFMGKFTSVKYGSAEILGLEQESNGGIKMKRFCLLVFALVMIAAVCAGCRSRNPMATTAPSVTTAPTSAPTTAPTTAPTSAPTAESTTSPTHGTEATTENGNGPLDGTTASTSGNETTEGASRSRARTGIR